MVYSSTNWSAVAAAYGTTGVSFQEAARAFNWFAMAFQTGSAIGTPREKIRIEPVESPIPEKTPAPPVEVPETKEPVGV